MNKSILTPLLENHQPRIVSRERNLDFAILFYPQEKRKVFVNRTLESRLKDSKGNTQVIRVVVKHDSTLGTLTTLDERVYYVLVEMWEEQYRPDICFFSEREIARRLNMPWGKSTPKTIRDSLFRLRLVGVEWNGYFYHKATDSNISSDRPFTILNHLALIDVKSKKVGSQVAEFGFDQMVIENLSSSFSRPVLLDQVLSFTSPLAQALYTYLEPRMYGTNHFHRTSYGLLIDDIGLVGKIYEEKRFRVRAINRAKEELIGKRFYYDEVIEWIEIEEGKGGDAVVHVHRTGEPKIKKVRLEVVPAPALPQPKQVQEQPKQQQPKPEPKNQAPESSQSTSKSKEVVRPASPPQNATTGTSEALSLVSEFYRRFLEQDLTDIEPRTVKNAEKKAQGLIEKHGYEFVAYLIDYCYKNKQKGGKCDPYSFSGLIHFIPQAKETLAKEQSAEQRRKRNDEDNFKRRVDDAFADHRKIYIDQYYGYVERLVADLSVHHHSVFRDFSKYWEESDLKQRFDKLECDDGPIKRGAYNTNLIDFVAKRGITIPTFEEWDEQLNPNKFNSEMVP